MEMFEKSAWIPKQKCRTPNTTSDLALGNIPKGTPKRKRLFERKNGASHDETPMFDHDFPPALRCFKHPKGGSKEISPIEQWNSFFNSKLSKGSRLQSLFFVWNPVHQGLWQRTRCSREGRLGYLLRGAMAAPKRIQKGVLRPRMDGLDWVGWMFFSVWWNGYKCFHLMSLHTFCGFLKCGVLKQTDPWTSARLLKKDCHCDWVWGFQCHSQLGRELRVSSPLKGWDDPKTLFPCLGWSLFQLMSS